MKTIAECANDFVDLRTRAGGDCVYVDKTDYFHRLVTDSGSNLFFIARPRRFGKSLMITTIKDYDDGIYMLNVPDEEVRRDLLTLVASQVADETYVPASRAATRVAPQFAAGFSLPAEEANHPTDWLVSFKDLPVGKEVVFMATPRECFGKGGRCLQSEAIRI